MTITQTVEIPENRRLTIEVPREIPTGTKARFDVIWFPQRDKFDLTASIKKIQTLCKEAPVSVDGFLEERRKENENEEMRLFGQFAKEATPGNGGSN